MKNACLVNSQLFLSLCYFHKLLCLRQTKKNLSRKHKICKRENISFKNKIFWYSDWKWHLFNQKYFLTEIKNWALKWNIPFEWKHQLFSLPEKNNVWSDSMQNMLLGFFFPTNAVDLKKNKKPIFLAVLIWKEVNICVAKRVYQKWRHRIWMEFTLLLYTFW